MEPFKQTMFPLPPPHRVSLYPLLISDVPQRTQGLWRISKQNSTHQASMAIQTLDEFPIKFYSTLIAANFLQDFYYYWLSDSRL